MAGALKLASWNVNSLRVRLPHVIDWLEATQTDILGLQETKVQDADFPVAALTEAGYDCVFSGQKTYNGVALLSRRSSVAGRLGGAGELVTDLPGPADTERRVMIATFGEWRIVNLYVPNGQSVASAKYEYKLDWLARLADLLADELTRHARIVVMGDFNIAPDDRDVHDPEGWRDAILCSDAERAALTRILDLGFTDTFRQVEPAAGHFSWWDYRAAAFARNRGLRIDLILASETAAAGLRGAAIDQGPRGLTRPSDHAPTVAEFTL